MRDKLLSKMKRKYWSRPPRREREREIEGNLKLRVPPY